MLGNAPSASTDADFEQRKHGDQAISSSVIVLIVVVGIAVSFFLAWLIVEEPLHRPWFFSGYYPFGFGDLSARIVEVDRVRRGGNIYVPLGSEGFTYPPSAIFLFLPFTALGRSTPYLLWTWLSILCLAGTYLVVLHATRSGSWLQHAAIGLWAAVVTVVIFPPIAQDLAWGQTGTILLLMVAADVLAVRGPLRGVLVGLATAVKLYPGVVIIFWILRRQWHTAATAIASCVVLMTAAWVLWPQSSSWFLTRLFLNGGDVSHLEWSDYQPLSSSVDSFFLRISFAPHWLALALGGLGSILVAVIGMSAAVHLDSLGFRVSALVTLVCVSVLISPVAWDHYFSFAPLLVCVILEVGLRSTSGKLSAAALVIFTIPWFVLRGIPRDTIDIGPPWIQSALAQVSRNALFVAALLVIAAGMLAARRRDERSTCPLAATS